MNGNRLLLDSNILIYLSRKELELDKFAKAGDHLGISIITVMEAKGYDFQNNEEEDIIDDLCDNLEKINIDDTIVNLVINLRKEAKIKLPDAIIIATAIAHDMSLITHNTADFNPFADRLNIIDPFTLSDLK